MTRFANYLRIVLPGIDPQISVLASRALGRLALAGGTLTADFVEFEVKRALEWLQGDRNDARRYAAVLVLNELGQNAPTLVYSYVQSILDHIWVALRDTKVNIREGAAEALRACLDILAQRESSQKPWLQVFEEAQRGLKMNTTETIHGSLLTIRELLYFTKFMQQQQRYNDIYEILRQYKDHRDALIRRTVVSLIPSVAALQPELFARDHLQTMMTYILNGLKKDKDKDRAPAFNAIGKVAIVMEVGMTPYLEAILAIIRESLVPRTRGKVDPNNAPVFVCISMLAVAVGQALTRHMHPLLELMFNTGLSEPLTEALVNLAQHIPPLLPTIQDKLLDMLAIVLSGQSYRHPGAPSTDTNGNSSVVHMLKELSIPEHQAEVTLALRTLGSFDFTGHNLNEFVRECVVSYLEADNAEVRQAAAQTCCSLLLCDHIHSRSVSTRAIQIVGEVLEKLLTVGITDPGTALFVMTLVLIF